MSGYGDLTLPFYYVQTLNIFFDLSKKKLMRKFSTEKGYENMYRCILLPAAFIVCYKIKHGDFDFHMHSSGEFSRLSP